MDDLSVSEACQINDLDHRIPPHDRRTGVSEACQINDLDHPAQSAPWSRLVSEACQINDLDHLKAWNHACANSFRSLSDQ